MYLGEGVDDDAIGDDEPHHLGEVALRDELVGHRQAKGHDPLEKEGADEDVGDPGPVGGGAANEDRRHRGKPIIMGPL